MTKEFYLNNKFVGYSRNKTEYDTMLKVMVEGAKLTQSSVDVTDTQGTLLLHYNGEFDTYMGFEK